MRQFQVPGGKPDHTQGFSKLEKRRLMMLVAGTLLVGAAILTGQWKARSADVSKPVALEEFEFEESVVAPDIDGAAIEALVSDKAPDERVVLEGDGVDLLSGLVRNMTPGQYLALGLRDLSPDVLADLTDNPAMHRGKSYTLRGWVDDIRTRNRNGKEEHIARLRLEGGGRESEQFAYFLARKVPQPLLEGDFLRIDGLFLKLFSDESRIESGRWLEGPLLVGQEARRSVAAFGPVTELRAREYADVVDDDLLSEDGRPVDPRTAIPYRAMWNLMAYARDLPEGAVDWSTATKLDDIALRDLAASGQEHRLQPYVIPISGLQATRVKVAPENPARIVRFTEGWIGNIAWSNVIRFAGPFQNREAEIGDLVEARGFFLKNFSYVSKDRGLRIAPYFVLHSLTIVHPEAAPIYATIIRTMLIGALLFLVGFIVLVIRSGRRSQELQQDLVQRRQARRKKTALQGQGT